MSLKHKSKSLVDTLDENSPLIKASKQPQLMLVRFHGRSTFFKNLKRNKRVTEEWKKRNPHKVKRPSPPQQGLSLEIDKEKYKVEKEQQNNQKKK